MSHSGDYYDNCGASAVAPFNNSLWAEVFDEEATVGLNPRNLFWISTHCNVTYLTWCVS